MTVALLPWWRNHGYLRDLYDYGLVLASNGHLDRGERPYVDYTTPIQAGFLGLSWLIERVGGGTYLALTRGGAGLIALGVLLFTLMLVRRWPWWAAVLVGVVVTVASASQHTILWHNALGVFCLALVGWGSALAPVWRRADWPWHLLVILGLVLGGLNKLNFHLVALAAALAWSWRAGLLRQASGRRVLLTGLIWLIAGVGLPLALELGWTGASFETWRHNVIGLAGASRAGTLPEVLTGRFLVTPIHNYYGPLLLPQVGLVGVAISLAAGLACWPAAGRAGAWDRVLLPLAVVLVAAAGAALLATNQEIAYLGLAAWLTLVVALWLGFSPARPSRALWGGGLLLPAGVLAVVAWISAWQGQRSQYGHSLAPRASYERVERTGSPGDYLAGVHLPPEKAHTLDIMKQWLPAPGPDGLRPVFYGAGTEWMQRVYPGLAPPGRPLWVHWGTTYGPREIWSLVQWTHSTLRQDIILAQLARDQWPAALQPTLQRFYRTDLFGSVTRRWYRISHTNEYFADGIAFADLAGGNVASVILRTEEQPVVVALPFRGDRLMLGVMGGEGLIRLSEPTQRFGADAVVERSAHGGDGPMHAYFKVIVHGANPENLRWSGRVDLPAGESRAELPFLVDALGGHLQLRVTVPEEFTGQLAAGYRNFQISHAIASAQGPPQLRPGVAAETMVTPEMIDRLLPDTPWRPQQLVVRGGQVEDGNLTLAPGGEVWLHSADLTGEMRGRLRAVSAAEASATVRVVWYKGGRLQITRQGQIPAEGTFAFHVWCAEPDGWIGLLVDPGEGGGRVSVHLDEVHLQP